MGGSISPRRLGRIAGSLIPTTSAAPTDTSEGRRGDRAAAPPDPTRPALALPTKPSIAVLPFHTISGDLEQEYFADGMVDEIITGLSRIKWLSVISRNSSFIYEKDKRTGVREVGDKPRRRNKQSRNIRPVCCNAGVRFWQCAL